MMVIAAPSLLVYGNALHRFIAGVPMYSETRLHGVQLPDEMPDLTFGSLISGSFERDYAGYFGRHFPLLAAAVKVKAQFYWSVLRTSPTWYITIGRQDTLYENGYLAEYCSRDITGFAPRARDWAAKLLTMQRWYAARGKVFLYLLTPSKAAIEPEFIPKNWPCKASVAQRVGFHAAYLTVLKQAGVNVVDAVETTERAKHDYSFPPFPPGGTHFNSVSAARAALELNVVLTHVGGWQRMYDFPVQWKLAAPNDVDTDLLNSLNVPTLGHTYLTPSLTFPPENIRKCVPVLMAQVGGSFVYQIDKVLQRIPCPPTIDFYEYFRNTMAFYPGDRRYPVNKDRRRWMLLDAAEVVLLEENEELAAVSDHGHAFFEFVASQIQADQRRK